MKARPLSDQLCACGCGRFTFVASKTSARDGARKDQPLKFIHGHSGSRGNLPPQGFRENNSNWRGNKACPQAGRYRAGVWFPLTPCEVCGSSGTERHHKDGNPLNNDPSNIAILCHKHHMGIHERVRTRDEFGRYRKGGKLGVTHRLSVASEEVELS